MQFDVTFYGLGENWKDIYWRICLSAKNAFSPKLQKVHTDCLIDWLINYGQLCKNYDIGHVDEL